MWIIYRLENYWLKFKWACQRFYRGYDDISVWNIDAHLREELIKLLTAYKEDRHCLWCFPGTLKIMTGKETDAVLETMIYHLKMSDYDFVEKELYGSNIDDDDYVIGCRSQEESERIGIVMNQNKDLALDLLKEFWYQLWD